MKRRQFIHLAKTSAIVTLAAGFGARWQVSQAQTPSESNLTIRWLGHTSFLFTGDGLRILVNPFRQIGCTAGFGSPKIETDLVLISSRLLDEGSIDGFPNNPALLHEPGVYQFQGTQIQGIRTIKDRERGRRFGQNVAWLWTQGGIRILHMGALAGPINIEERILMGRPDLLLIPVGGGPKAYTPTEAAAVIASLNPRLVIPTHYKTLAADVNNCDLVPVDNFLDVMTNATIRNVNSNTLTLTRSQLNDDGLTIGVMSYNFNSSASINN
ncbi:MBL fold metallo-hydrolase [Limnospira platensis]|uniref:MBL fold metallo-hydrolase n=1 Tax=Limnospira platensis TaxID=118562 RepID=UPI0021AA789E|nr:L-ascorbate metabolism protein UlaG, beta-lactamase superfamily [Arthrospira platensis C1]